MNKYKQIESRFGNIYVICLLALLTVIAGIVSYSTNYRSGYVLITALMLVLTSLCVVSKIKVKNRYSTELGFNFLKTTIEKKSDSNKDKIIIGDFLEYKGKLHVGFSYEVSDYDSMTKLNKEGFNSQHQTDEALNNFIKLLPDYFEFVKLPKKQKSQIPKQFKRLGIEVSSYKDTFTYTYFLLLSVEKNKVEQAINSLKTVFPAQLRQLNIEETIALLQ